MNSVIFIGDSKDNFIFKYDFVENVYKTIPFEAQSIGSKIDKENDFSLNFCMSNQILFFQNHK
jgi:hypothetical protein